MFLLALSLALFYILQTLISAATAANIVVTPPDSLVIAYPTIDLHVGDLVYLWSGDQEISHAYFGFYRNTSISVTHPDGTVQPVVSIADMCRGGAVQYPNPDSVVVSGGFLVTDTGIHTAHWNVTYGTLTDGSVANASYCDSSTLSYQTFILNATMNAVPRVRDSFTTPTVTQRVAVTSTFSSEPTGHYVEVVYDNVVNMASTKSLLNGWFPIVVFLTPAFFFLY